MIIIGVDPGHTTGVVVLSVDASGDLTLREALEVAWDDRFEIVDDIMTRWVDPYGNEDIRVVSESFNLYPSMAAGQAHIRSSFPSVEVIGIVSYGCHLYHFTFSQQPPSARSRVQILSQHKAALKGLIHAQDAYRHARYYYSHLKHLNKV
jgi:hypothetical protein